MKQKRILTLLLSVLFIFSLLIGCGQSGNQAATTVASTTAAAVAETTTTANNQESGDTSGQTTTKEAETTVKAAEATTAATTAATESMVIKKMRYLVPGNTQPDTDMMTKVISDAMQADGVPVEYEPVYIGWDVWEQKINTMLSTGEPFEMFHIMDDLIPFASYVNRDALSPIGAMLDEYGPNVINLIPDWVWGDAKVGGETYIIPAYWVSLTGGTPGSTVIRKDLREKTSYGPEFASLDDFFDCMVEMQNLYEGSEKLKYAVQTPAYTNMFLYDAVATQPYTAWYDDLIMITQDGKVHFLMDTPEFKNHADFMARCVEAGLVHDDLLSATVEQATSYTYGGTSLWGNNYFALDDKIAEETNGGSLETVIVVPNAKKVRNATVKNSNGIPWCAENPEAAIQFVNWMYANQENFDLFMYGIEGVHWVDGGVVTDGAGRTDRGLVESKRDENDNVLYAFADWQIGNLNYMRYGVDTHPEIIRTRTDPGLDAIDSVALGFIFDSSPVQNEYQQCVAEVTATIWPLKWGFINYDENYDAYRAKMTAAGIDKVIDEYQRQLDEYRKTSGR